MTKEKFLKEILTKPTWNQKQILEIANQLVLKEDDVSDKNNKYSPNVLKVGDICFLGTLVHPCIILKIEKEVCFYVLLSTTEDVHNLCKTKTRFLDCFVSYTTGICNTKLLKYKCSYENPKHIKEIKKLLLEKNIEMLL